MPQLIQGQSLIDAMFPGPVGKWVEEATPAQLAEVLSLIGNNFIADNITSVWAINNYFLEGMYLLKKEEVECRLGRKAEEKLLLHVTRENAVDSIISDNFDWRKVKRSLYGFGTSFSDDVVYCHRYCNFNIGHERAVFVSKVLVTKWRQSIKDEVIPPPEFDTTVGNQGKVFVKFCDSEYLPIFVAFYNVSEVDPADIQNDEDREKHLIVLKGVEKYTAANTRCLQKKPKRLISHKVPKPRKHLPKKPHHSMSSKLEVAKRDSFRDSFNRSLLVNHSRTGRIVPSRASKTSRTAYASRKTHQNPPITSQDHYSKGRNVSPRPPTPTTLEEDKEQETPGCCSKFMDCCCLMFACLCFC